MTRKSRVSMWCGFHPAPCPLFPFAPSQRLHYCQIGQLCCRRCSALSSCSCIVPLSWEGFCRCGELPGLWPVLPLLPAALAMLSAPAVSTCHYVTEVWMYWPNVLSAFPGHVLASRPVLAILGFMFVCLFYEVIKWRVIEKNILYSYRGGILWIYWNILRNFGCHLSQAKTLDRPKMYRGGLENKKLSSSLRPRLSPGTLPSLSPTVRCHEHSANWQRVWVWILVCQSVL